MPVTTVSLVENAIDRAGAFRSKLSMEAVTVPGYSGKKVRHLVNNLASAFTPYLEVGCYQGSTLIAAAMDNTGLIIGVDNFTDETKPGQYMVATRRALLQNLAAWSERARPSFIDGSCWVTRLRDIRCCFFDGEHTEQSHYDSIDKLYDCFKPVFVFVVDDFNRQNVRVPTQEAIKARRLSVLFTAWLGHDQTDDVENWWNGLGIFVLSK